MMVRFLSARRILLAYFGFIFLALVWLLMNAGMWCPETKNAAAFPKDVVDASNGKINLLSWHERLSKWQERLVRQERTLHQKYPLVAHHISNEANSLPLPTIYLITPTYFRAVQKAELSRLAHTFMLVPNVHWIIIEDSEVKTKLVSNFIQRSGLNYTHLNVATPANYKMDSTDPNWLKPRGVLQRNAGLKWIRDHFDPNHQQGIVYFADDDNTYDLRLFDEMRWTLKVSVWPVGLVGYLRYEAPVVKNGKVVRWFTYFESNRPFAMDMAGFAINAELLIDFPNAQFKLQVRRGYQESDFLSQLVTINQLEPKAENCTKVLVWHTRTEKANLKNEDKFKKQGYPGSDMDVEV